MKKILILFLCLFSLNATALEKKTTFDKELFNKAQSDGKVVVVSSWIKYCPSCSSQMKVLEKAKNDFNVQYQTTLLIFKDNKEVYRSIGEIKKEAIYKALKSSI